MSLENTSSVKFGCIAGLHTRCGVELDLVLCGACRAQHSRTNATNSIAQTYSVTSPPVRNVTNENAHYDVGVETPHAVTKWPRHSRSAGAVDTSQLCMLLSPCKSMETQSFIN